MMIAISITFMLLVFCFGALVGCRMEDNYWADHGTNQYRTAVFHKGLFFYVVPESVYVDMQKSALPPWKVNEKLNKQCEICYRALEKIASGNADATEAKDLATEALHFAEMRK